MVSGSAVAEIYRTRVSTCRWTLVLRKGYSHAARRRGRSAAHPSTWPPRWCWTKVTTGPWTSGPWEYSSTNCWPECKYVFTWKWARRSLPSANIMVKGWRPQSIIGADIILRIVADDRLKIYDRFFSFSKILFCSISWTYLNSITVTNVTYLGNGCNSMIVGTICLFLIGCVCIHSRIWTLYAPGPRVLAVPQPPPPRIGFFLQKVRVDVFYRHICQSTENLAKYYVRVSVNTILN